MLVNGWILADAAHTCTDHREVDMLDEEDWGFHRPETDFCQYKVENIRAPLFANTHDQGWVWRTEVVDVAQFIDTTFINEYELVTITAEYATKLQLENKLHEIFTS